VRLPSLHCTLMLQGYTEKVCNLDWLLLILIYYSRHALDADSLSEQAEGAEHTQEAQCPHDLGLLAHVRHGQDGGGHNDAVQAACAQNHHVWSWRLMKV
jgi:hypothetical protein